MKAETHEVQLNLPDGKYIRLTGRELIEWFEETVPILVENNNAESQHLINGILTMMDTISHYSEFISGDDEINEKYCYFNELSGAEEEGIH